MIKVEIDVPQSELKKAVDEDIEAFNQFFQTELKNEPLVPSERAIISTYLWWKTNREKTNAG